MRSSAIDNEDVRRLRGLRHLVGNAPILAVELTYRGTPRRIYAKAEQLNLTGSIKDRMALHIVREGRRRGLLAAGARLVEATSGNTGISFAAVGRAMGHPVTIFMPDWMSRERVELIRSLGAEIRLVSRAQGGFVGAIELAESYARRTPGAFLPRQFSNRDNVAAHRETTGPEIWWQMRNHGLTPDVFVAGVGTGGTIMGVGQALRELSPTVKLHPLEPASSPTLRTGHCVGRHRIQGVSDEFIPPIVDLDFLDEVVDVEDGDAILMAQKLARELGLGVGISSGANFLGALALVERYGGEANVVTVFPDDHKKYLSTDLLREEPAREGYLSPEVELLRFSAFKRVCRTCCEPSDCLVPQTSAGEDGVLPGCPLWRDRVESPV
ncbi:MAG TPA: cysteine synthase family protein [Candidatus Polarisedimenticolaceae bacterium]|nr:cysteine synthase family protein [Candidatus Polarisedimenticolaceae bacterium]